MFVDKYRPKTFDDVIGRDDIIEKLKSIIESPKEMPHIMFSGIPGTGKTLLSEIIANTLFGKATGEFFYQFNASQDRGIDMIRDRVYNLAKVKPMGAIKIILMDEADAMTNEAQFALRRIMEQFSSQTKFIFTCNYRYKIINPLLSRLQEFELNPIDVKTVALYLKKIANKEGLKFEDSQLISFAKSAAGDVRKALNLLEGNTSGSKTEAVFNMSFDNFKKMSKNDMVMLAFKGNPEDIFAEFWDYITANKFWDVIPYLADCQSKMNISVHKTIFICDLMMKVNEIVSKK